MNGKLDIKEGVLWAGVLYTVGRVSVGRNYTDVIM